MTTQELLNSVSTLAASPESALQRLWLLGATFLFMVITTLILFLGDSTDSFFCNHSVVKSVCGGITATVAIAAMMGIMLLTASGRFTAF